MSGGACVTSTSGAPYVFTQPVMNLRSNSVELTGMATPRGLATNVYFEYRKVGDASFTRVNPTTTNIGSGLSVVRSTVQINGLIAERFYEYRFVATNSSGTNLGRTRRFITGGKVFIGGDSSALPAQVSRASNVSLSLNRQGTIGFRCATLMDGSVMGWGATYPTYNYVNAGVGVSSVDCAGSSVWAILSNGSVKGWAPKRWDSGGNDLAVSPAINNAIQLAAASGYPLTSTYPFAALLADGTVREGNPVPSWAPAGYKPKPAYLSNASLSNVVAIASLWQHVLALRHDGSVDCWGLNSSGQCNIPTEATSGVVDIAAGESFSLALKADGRVIGWGAARPAGMVSTDIREISAGFGTALFIKNDDSLALAGTNADGQLNFPEGRYAMIRGAGQNIALGWSNAAPTVSSYELKAKGGSDNIIQLRGQDPTNDPLTFQIKSLPQKGHLYRYDIATGNRGAALSVGDWVTDVEGRVIFTPTSNEFGDPSNSYRYTSFTFLASDGEFNSASQATLTLIVRRYNNAFTYPPTMIRANSAVLRGAYFPNGFGATAWFEWGERGSYGNTLSATASGSDQGKILQYTATLSGLLPHRVYQARFVVRSLEEVFYGHPQVFITGGKVTAWGTNGYGLTNIPSALSDAVDIEAGTFHSLAVNSSGVIWGWGLTPASQVPAGISNPLALAAGRDHSLVIDSNGVPHTWGTDSSNFGHLIIPSGLGRIIAAAAGDWFSLVLQNDGVVKAWGYGSFGQTTVPTELDDAVSLAAGGAHGMALRANGKVITWGSNSFNQVRQTVGATTYPDSLTDIVAVAAGITFSMALRNNGTVVAWGDDSSNQCNVPALISNSATSGFVPVVSIAAGEYYGLAVRADGSSVLWGNGSQASAIKPAGIEPTVKLNAGHFHSVALSLED